jgi:transcription initiation factor TFIIIB Brf1 subunit/transcription initiation factor TFIIB
MRSRAHSFGRRLPRGFTQSKSPIFLAAVALYLGAGSAGEGITLQAIARTVDVGASSIPKNLKQVRRLAGLG